ncbi:unnamed protein product [Boreogadus saida]
MGGVRVSVEGEGGILALSTRHTARDDAAGDYAAGDYAARDDAARDEAAGDEVAGVKVAGRSRGRGRRGRGRRGRETSHAGSRGSHAARRTAAPPKGHPRLQQRVEECGNPAQAN